MSKSWCGIYSRFVWTLTTSCASSIVEGSYFEPGTNQTLVGLVFFLALSNEHTGTPTQLVSMDLNSNTADYNEVLRTQIYRSRR